MREVLLKRGTIMKTAFMGFLLISSHLNAQNIVIDPSLEDTLKCPYTVGRFYSPTNPAQHYISDWRATTRASPDLHHTCGYNNYQPHTGEGYAGIILWDPAETREYISASFNTPMTAGECYYVELYVALRESSTRTVDEFQFSFSNTDPTDYTWLPPTPLVVPVHHQLATPVTSNTWEKRSFFYQASGGEEWLTIGNFVDNNSTTVSQVSNIGSVSAYYYIDDVTITKLDLGPDLTICPPDSALITSNIDCPSLQYSWSNGDTGISTSTTSAGTISLTISGNGVCAATDDVVISLPTGGGITTSNDTTISIGGAANLTVSGTSSPTWSPSSSLDCSNCLDPIATPSQTQTYLVTGLDENGCYAEDSVTVNVIMESDPDPDPVTPINDSIEEIYFYAPNTFTPDGDAYNNVFEVKGGPFDSFELLIWDRWGQVVFESKDPATGWDGTNANGVIKQGTFTYQLSIITNSNHHSKWIGHINVLP